MNRIRIWLGHLATHTPVALALALLLAGYAGYRAMAFLADGLPLFFDAHSYLARSRFVAQSLAAGAFPDWSFEWYGGYRLLEFVSPGYYWLTGALGAALGDVTAATKIVLWTAQVASALAFYGFARRATQRPAVAFAASILFVESAQRIWVLGVIGNHPTALLYVAAPLWLWHAAGRGAPASRSESWIAGSAALLAAMIFGHLTNTLAVLPAMLAFALARLWQTRDPGWDRWRGAGALALALGVGLGLTAFITLPMLLDLELASLSLDAAIPATPSLEPLPILAGLAAYSKEHSFLASHGLLWFGVGVAAALYSASRRGARWRPLAAGAAVSLVSVVLLGDRAALALGFFLFPLCALALDAAARAMASRLSGATWLGPLAVVLLAVIWPGVGPPVRVRYEAEGALSAYANLPETATRSRTFDVTPARPFLSGFYGPGSFSSSVSGRAIPFGAFPQGAPLAGNLTLALFSRLSADLDRPSGHLSETSLDALYLSHVQILIDRSTPARFLKMSLDPTTSRRIGDHALLLRTASPALFSGRLSPPPETDGYAPPGAEPLLLTPLRERWRQEPLKERRDASLAPIFRTRTAADWRLFSPLLRAMKIDRSGARAEQLFAERPLASRGVAATTPGSFAVLDHREAVDRVEIVARSSAPGYVRLCYTWDPDLVVRLDGRRAESVPGALGGAAIVAFPEGVHRIELRGPTSRLRRALLGASLALAAALSALALRARGTDPA